MGWHRVHKPPGVDRWWADVLHDGPPARVRSLKPVGPIAQRWLDNDAPLVCGLPTAKRAMRQRVLRNHGAETVDEFVIHGCTVHLEQMGDGYYWIGIDRPEERPNGPTLHVDLVTRSRAGIRCTVRDEEWDWDIDQTHP